LNTESNADKRLSVNQQKHKETSLKTIREIANKLDFKLKVSEQLENKTFLITGGSGNLATAFINVLNKYAPKSRIIHPGKYDLNVENFKSFEVFRNPKPDFVLHCAAKVDADFSEIYPNKAKENIVNGTINAHRFSVETGAKFFYPQSFLIFDGREIPTTESTVAKPLSKYGELKLECENLIQSSHQALIVRMGGFFGGESKDRNFVGKMYKLFKTKLDNKDYKIEVGERIWQPTYTKDLAKNVLLLISLDKTGIYNMASLGQATFLDVAKTMAEVLDTSQKLEISPFPKNLSWKLDVATRPESVLMLNSRLDSEGINLQRNWKDALIEYLNSPFFSKF